MKPIPILYEDQHLVVADKPPGVLSVPGGHDERPALPELLRERGYELLPVHRLDREVSGAILLARTEPVRSALEELFRSHAIEKIYWALCSGRVRPAQGSWHAPILEDRTGARVSALGKPSRTHYRTLQTFAAATELEIRLETGRRNQIRLHAAHGGYPLVGERKYARGKDSALRLRSRRVALHAWRLAFRHPLSGAQVEVEAPLPDDLLELRQRAGPRQRE